MTRCRFRDVFVLFSGRLLGTVGRLTAAAGPAAPAGQLAGAAAELLSLPAIAAHEEPYVRRNALFAASQVRTVLQAIAFPSRSSSAERQVGRDCAEVLALPALSAHESPYVSRNALFAPFQVGKRFGDQLG